MGCMLPLPGQDLVVSESLHQSSCTDYCGYAGGQPPSLQVGTIPTPWAALYAHACFKLCEKLRLEGNQSSKMLLYAQRALAVARVGKLHGSDLYATLLENLIHIHLKWEPSFWTRHGEHAVPYEAFTAAVVVVKQRRSHSREKSAQYDNYIRDYIRWVKEMQAGLVRCTRLASFRLCCSQTLSPLFNWYSAQWVSVYQYVHNCDLLCV